MSWGLIRRGRIGDAGELRRVGTSDIFSSPVKIGFLLALKLAAKETFQQEGGGQLAFGSRAPTQGAPLDEWNMPSSV
jgi:hypothetical protein